MTRLIAVDPELEDNYNNMARRSDAPELLQRWSELSADYRRRADAAIDCAYGNGARERMDIFRCGVSQAPLFVYLHGGYWQRGDKSIYSFVAEAFNEAGVDVAIIGYPLCPQVSMTQLFDRIVKALAWLHGHAAKLGVSADRINLSGHSAGGHLTAMCLTTRWQGLDPGLPADLVKTAIPLSGLYRLEPLRHTTIADALNLGDAETGRLSPCNLAVAYPSPTLIAVGGAESGAFFSQADDLIESWSDAGLVMAKYIEPGADHFDIVARLTDPESEMFQRAVAWLS
ncbi:MAG: alpha/beta hydrolase [Gammaproteobacteria bacterium]|nr:alpha/beta hydrolase [Gammaproteobacteria bacterium]MDH3534501.1 alpha/beta hydrolase [Gammaproteobacteria bacterium]